MIKVMNAIKIVFVSFVIFLLSACGNVERVEHIEVYMAETTEQNDDGLHEITGYKKVNAITTIEEDKKYVKTDIKAIEDFYDTEGKYIKTEIIHSTFNKSHITQVEEGENRREDFHEPSTILLQKDDLKTYQLDNLSEGEEEEVKEHVLSFMDKL